MSPISHRTIQTNGINMHVAEKGAGPLVILCHGFPESWYSWRHQIEALAAAGFHVVAPDMRGYGQTDIPKAIDQFTLLHLVGDIIGLIDAIGVDTAVIAGHDWGAPVAWNAALLRPDRFRGVIGLSVPFRPRIPVRPSTVMPQTPDAIFYQLYFQQPGSAEKELEHDVRASIRSILLSLAGEAPKRPDGNKVADNGLSMVPRNGGLRSLIDQDARQPVPLPNWITDADIDFYTAEFSRTGFRGGLNWYRNIDRNWELLAPFVGARVTVPALYIAGERDLVVGFSGVQKILDDLAKTVPQLRSSLILPGCGHWTQQERPQEVNAAMLRFLESL